MLIRAFTFLSSVCRLLQTNSLDVVCSALPHSHHPQSHQGESSRSPLSFLPTHSPPSQSPALRNPRCASRPSSSPPQAFWLWWAQLPTFKAMAMPCCSVKSRSLLTARSIHASSTAMCRVSNVSRSAVALMRARSSARASCLAMPRACDV
ncbi:hypothetical protein DE146DRAFT_303145 [Phaeosphaeria sp. MPI-PUGE-AT-0046c]|nr:hypothetical protein DE146DRAFT_303145 [Phaeosphaeria sp. MPI-PUGE-AT-0046c]